MSSPDALPFLLVHGAWLWKAALAALALFVAVGWWALWYVWPRPRPAPPPLPEAAEEVSGMLVVEGEAGDKRVRSLAVDSALERYADATYDLRPAKLFLQTDDDRKIELLGEVRVLAGSRAAVGRAGVPRAVSSAELGELRSAAPWLHHWRLSFSDVRQAIWRTVQAGDRVIARGVLERGPAVGASAGETDFRSAAVAWTMRGAPIAKAGATAGAAADADAQRAADADADAKRAADADADAKRAAGADAASLADQATAPLGPIELVAKRPAVERVRPPLLALVAVFGGVLLAGYQAEKLLGEAWEEECSDLYLSRLSPKDDAEAIAKLPLEPFPFDNSHGCIRATAWPGHREYALYRIGNMLAEHPKQSEPLLRRMNALDQFLGNCDKAATRFAELGRYEEAVTAARRCGDRRAEHLALVSLGRFEEAAALPVPETEARWALPTATTLIAAGRWSEAAAAAEAQAAELLSRERKPEEERSYQLTAMSYRCLGVLFRHFGGSGEALGQLKALRGAPLGASCAPMIAVAEGPTAENLRIAEGEPYLSDTADLLDRMALFAGLRAADRREPSGAPEELLVTLDAGMGLRGWELWLAPMGDEGIDALPPVHRAYALRWRAAHQVLLGDLEGARRSAAEALRRRVEALGPLDPEERPDCVLDRCAVLHLPSAIALFTRATDLQVRETPAGRDEISKEWLKLWMFRYGRLFVRDGRSFEGTHFGAGGDDLEQVLRIAQGGDGRPLASYMTKGRYRFPWWNDADLIAVLPRVTEGLDEIRTQLLWTMPRDSYLPTLADYALRALARRTVLQLAGLEAQAARWDAIIQRYDRVLSDPKRRWGLMLYDL